MTEPDGQPGYQWVCVESCTADDPHGEHCDWQTTAPSPDTVTVPKAEWDALVGALAGESDEAVACAADDLLTAVRAAEAVR